MKYIYLLCNLIVQQKMSSSIKELISKVHSMRANMKELFEDRRGDYFFCEGCGKTERLYHDDYICRDTQIQRYKDCNICHSRCCHECRPLEGPVCFLCNFEKTHQNRVLNKIIQNNEGQRFVIALKLEEGYDHNILGIDIKNLFYNPPPKSPEEKNMIQYFGDDWFEVRNPRIVFGYYNNELTAAIESYKDCWHQPTFIKTEKISVEEMVELLFKFGKYHKLVDMADLLIDLFK